MKTLTKKQTGFYFETDKEHAQIFADDFYWTKKRKEATDRNNAFLVDLEESWHGYYDETFSKDFFVHNEDIVFFDTIDTIKKELNLTDDDIAEMFNYKNKLAYSNSSAKTRIETALVSFYLLIKKSEGKNFK